MTSKANHQTPVTVGRQGASVDVQDSDASEPYTERGGLTPQDLSELGQSLGGSVNQAKKSLQGTVYRLKKHLAAENERLHNQLQEQFKLAADQQQKISDLQAEARRGNRMQMWYGLLFTVVGAALGWLIAGLATPGEIWNTILTVLPVGH